MTTAFRCPECGSANHVFKALNESLLAIASDLTTEAVLQRIVGVARGLVHTTFAAVGVRSDADGFSHFITSTSADTRLPAPPYAQRVLKRMLAEGTHYSTTDVQQDPAFDSWPDGYPDLKSFLAVPIRRGDAIVGAFYLGNENVWGFTGEHHALVDLLGPHAALAIENARLYEQSRELSVVQERNRLARELHDSVTQTLFSMKLAAESASVVIDSNPAEARRQLAHLQDLARQASTEMRSMVFELRPPELEIDGFVSTLRKHIEVLRRIYPVRLELHQTGEHVLEPTREKEVFRVVQEALNNAVRHSGAGEITVDLVMEEDKFRVTVTDDGSGFDPAASHGARHFGLTSMKERAEVLGAKLDISSAPERGTVVSLEV